MASFTTMVTTALFLFFLRLAYPPSPPPPQSSQYHVLAYIIVSLPERKRTWLRPSIHIVERFIDNTFPRVVLQRDRCSANMLFFCSSFNLSILIPWFEHEICMYILFLGMTVLCKKQVQRWILVGFSLSLCLMTVYPYPEDRKLISLPFCTLALVAWRQLANTQRDSRVPSEADFALDRLQAGIRETYGGGCCQKWWWGWSNIRCLRAVSVENNSGKELINLYHVEPNV